jgi:Dolichyl-phosphate-mannose-protein mannosyltransferase
MCDVPMLSLWVWSLVLWDGACESNRASMFLLAGGLAGLSVLTKYTVVTLLPLLPILAILKTRKLGPWLVGLAPPVLMIVGYELYTSRMYGHGLLFLASHFPHDSAVTWLGGWKAKLIVELAFIGGGLLSALLFSPWLWRRSVFLIGGMITLGLCFWLSREWDRLGLMMDPDPGLGQNRAFMMQIALFAVGGVSLVVLAGAELWRRDVVSGVLALWIMDGLLFATVIGLTVNARRILPIVPAVAILVVRRMDRSCFGSRPAWCFAGPLLLAGFVSIGVTAADYQLAATNKGAAQDLSGEMPRDHKLWFKGLGGFRYYMEAFGGQPLDIEKSKLEPGDVVVMCFPGDFITLPPGSVGLRRIAEYAPRSWFNVMANGDTQAAGFYEASWGPVPFAVGRLPVQQFFVLDVYDYISFCTRPLNSREVQAGALPDFGKPIARVNTSTNDVTVAKQPSPAVAEQLEMGERCQEGGSVEAAVEHYRNALGMDPNNVVALNNLAWILATAEKPELRNGEEAVQLAGKAANLTEGRMPLFLGTLAAAYAQLGQFKDACDMANTARVLALVTGQKEIASKNADLQRLYARHRTASR